MLLLGLATGPLQARALGPDGRGNLAAILVPLSFAPFILDFGLQQFVARKRAQGAAASSLLGTFIPVSAAFGVLGVALALPVSNALGGNRPAVTTLLLIGLCLSPISVVFQTVHGLVWGEERFGLLARVRLVAAAVPATAILVLFLVDELTVTSAAISTMAGGIMASGLLVPAVFAARPQSFDRRLAREGLGFGARTWLGTLSGVANGRLDQLLMVPLASAAELGYYAVAVTTASLAAVFVGAVGTTLTPRAARSESESVAKSTRVTIVFVALTSVAIASSSPLLVPLVFGSEFRPAVPMVAVLAVGSVPGAAAMVLGGALIAKGRPGTTTTAQMLGLAFTAPALAALLPSTGGLGAAAIASASAYIMAVYLVSVARKEFDVRTNEVLIVRKSDAVDIIKALRRK